MHDFLLKEITFDNVLEEIKSTGFDSCYAVKAVDKFIYKNFKIFNLSPAQANIIKQTALTVGADCATHREVITGKVEKSSVILGGSKSQLNKISEKLKFQPFGLRDLGGIIQEKINYESSDKTLIMGSLNVTVDSFSDGGVYNSYDKAVAHLEEMINDGADIIDIGAESTKPYSTPVCAEEQLSKILPILDYVKSKNIEIPISIDTRSSKVAKMCIDTGVVSIINDVSGGDYDCQMFDVLAKNSNVRLIIQHSLGTPENMQDSPNYRNLIDDIYIDLGNKVKSAIAKGILVQNIVVDPGIGFGKTKEQNFEIIKRWKEFRTIGCPILIGLSRKSLLGMPNADNSEKDTYTLALNAKLIQENIDIIRVHNVKIHKIFQNFWS